MYGSVEVLRKHTHEANGLKVGPQISLLGGADGPLMYLAHSRKVSSSFQIVFLEGEKNLPGRRTSKLLSLNLGILTFNLGCAAATQKSYF